MAVMLLGAVGLQAQEKKEKLSKEERKAKRELAKEARTEAVLAMIENQSFVLEAHSLFNRYGSRIFVPANVNFIALNDQELTIQVGNFGAIGNNGLGGFTAKGRVSSITVSEVDDKGRVNLRIEASTIGLGHTSILMEVAKDGSARATVTNNFGGRLTFQGDLFAPEESRVYEGLTLF